MNAAESDAEYSAQYKGLNAITSKLAEAGFAKSEVYGAMKHLEMDLRGVVVQGSEWDKRLVARDAYADFRHSMVGMSNDSLESLGKIAAANKKGGEVDEPTKRALDTIGLMVQNEQQARAKEPDLSH